jgi:hypothetical protein
VARGVADVRVSRAFNVVSIGGAILRGKADVRTIQNWDEEEIFWLLAA